MTAGHEDQCVGEGGQGVEILKKMTLQPLDTSWGSCYIHIITQSPLKNEKGVW